MPFDAKTGQTVLPSARDDVAAVIVANPTLFGVIEDVDTLTDFAHTQNALAIACVNPVSLAILKEPGAWGEQGADIACGEGQPLGIPMASGGPYFGFLGCKKAFIRQLPGRIVGRTEDADGKTGFTLTLQAREQHIRRAKATSNICTNQGLMVTAATIHMSILGHAGLQSVACHSHANTQDALLSLIAIPGVTPVFASPFFHETVLQLPVPAETVLAALRDRGILGGVALEAWYPSMKNTLLICLTETKTKDDIARFAVAMREALKCSGSQAVVRERDGELA